MAQIQTLQDRLSGDTVYPVTTPKAVIDERGVDLETLMAQQKQDNGNALKEYVKKTEQAQELAQKQNKLTPTTDLHITDDNVIGLTELAKMRLFIDMWNTAWGRYGKYDPVNAPDPQHPFCGNTLWMTYEEAVITYLWGNKLIEKGFCATDTPMTMQIRTNLPPINTPQRLFLNLSELFRYQQKMEVCRVTGSNQQWVHLIHAANTWLSGVFDGCTKLRVVLGVMSVEYYTAGENIFRNCISLEEIQIFGLKANLDISTCPKLSVGTISYIVANSANTSPITITVHPDVYAKLTGDTTNAAAANLSDEELAQWMALIPLAAEKNITFATV